MFTFGKHLKYDEALTCSFCMKSQDQTEALIGTPSESPVRAYICDECIETCYSILEGQRQGSPELTHPANTKENSK